MRSKPNVANKREKSPKPKNKRTRVIFGREKSVDGLVRAMTSVCRSLGMKIIPEEPAKKKKK